MWPYAYTFVTAAACVVCIMMLDENLNAATREVWLRGALYISGLASTTSKHFYLFKRLTSVCVGEEGGKGGGWRT